MIKKTRHERPKREDSRQEEEGEENGGEKEEEEGKKKEVEVSFSSICFHRHVVCCGSGSNP